MRINGWFAAASLLLALIAHLGAQDFDGSKTHLLNGSVVVGENSPPPGRARVTLYNSLRILVSETVTSSSGGFSFAGIAHGNYRIVVELAGFQEAAVEVSVYPGNSVTTVMPIVLKASGDPHSAPPPGTVEAAQLGLSKKAKKIFEKGKRALGSGKLEEARRFFEQTIRTAPKLAEAHDLMGITECLLGEYKKAEGFFRRAIDLDPRRADEYFGLGKVLNLLQRPGEALPTIRKGLELSPNSGLGLAEESRAEFQLQDYVRAEHSAQAALKQTPAPPNEIYLILANCDLNLHRYAEAATDLDDFLSRAPNSSSAPKAREVLSKLKGAGFLPKN